MAGEKKDQGKTRFSLMPWAIIRVIADVYTFGATKYAARNWEQGIEISRLFDAAMRHLTAWWEGEEVDPESGFSHLAHAAWNCIGMLWMKINRPEMDDRPCAKGLES